MQVREEDARRMLTAAGIEAGQHTTVQRVQKKVNTLDKITDQNVESRLEGDDLTLFQSILAARKEGELIKVVEECTPDEEEEDLDEEAPDDEQEDTVESSLSSGAVQESSEEDEEDMSVREMEESVVETRKVKGARNRPGRPEEPSEPKRGAKAQGEVQVASRGKPGPKEGQAVKEEPKAAQGKADKRTKGKGVVATLVRLLAKASGKKPLTKDDLVERLHEKFPGSSEKSLRKTVDAQLWHLKMFRGLEVHMDDEGGIWATAREEE